MTIDTIESNIPATNAENGLEAGRLLGKVLRAGAVFFDPEERAETTQAVTRYFDLSDREATAALRHLAIGVWLEARDV